MKYISLNWKLALKFSIGTKKRMRDCRILMAHDCIYIGEFCFSSESKKTSWIPFPALNLHQWE